MSEPELDPLLLQVALNGDAKAYANVLDWAAGKLRPYFKRLLLGVSGVEAEDMVQEALLALHTKWHTYDPSRPFAPWMYTLARHKMVDALRRKHIHLPLEAADDVAIATDERHAGQELAPLLATLPEAQRRAIELTKVQELSVEEAARTLGRSLGAVKLLVHRGMETLRGRFGS